MPGVSYRRNRALCSLIAETPIVVEGSGEMVKLVVAELETAELVVVELAGDVGGRSSVESQ